ncbi:hypothetical protein Taro_051885 [Colocasia esculenta]|uniref:PB1 domain-containing protein n=1 Tax=Colocasia esculenta TaxID=4460 RepID=A0A843XIL7_COLES|nr:hypothetical protein [Colocasia esculenta]
MALVVREAASPRLKFLCSYGGRILPRPSDGQLKYVGGETRVVAVPRFLKEKIASVYKGEAVIKYQMASEDLDALVSVTCDEDLHHMIEEYDRLEASCSACTHPRLRVFLFPVPTPAATPTFDGTATPGGKPQLHPHPLHVSGISLEQRYIEAINGGAVGRPPPAGLRSPRGLTIVPPARSAFAESSAESSPTSAIEAFGRDSPGLLACGGGRCAWRHSGGEGGAGRAMQDIHRARSSPNLQHGHWPQQQQQQQQQGLRLQVLHGGAAVEYDAGNFPMGNALRWLPPPAHHAGTVYYSPAHTPRQQGGAGGQYADELWRPEERG